MKPPERYNARYVWLVAPVTWVLISEIFPNRIRGAAISVSVFTLWIACFALSFTFPALNAAPRPAGTFRLYSGICLEGFVRLGVRARGRQGGWRVAKQAGALSHRHRLRLRGQSLGEQLDIVLS